MASAAWRSFDEPGAEAWDAGSPDLFEVLAELSPDIGACVLALERGEGGTVAEIVVSKPESEHAKVYREIADKVWAKVEREIGERTENQPRIVIS